MKFAAAIFALMWMFGDAAAQAVRIPPLHGIALSGEKIDLPDALRDKTGVLVLGFSQASRDQVTAWGKRLSADYRDSATVVYYEMPVLESVPRLLRGWVTKKIAETVPDRARNRFLPVLDHEAQWKTAASYSRSDNAYVIVVDSEGKVRGRIEGAPSDGKFDDIKNLLATNAASLALP